MRSFVISAAFLLGTSMAAHAAGITVLSAGLAVPPLKAFAAQWTQATGNKVTFVSGPIDKIRDDAAAGVPGDLVVLPPADLSALSAKIAQGSVAAMGRVAFGLSVKAGTPHPDISTVEKLAALLKTATKVAYPDPAGGSASGRVVGTLLARPDFAGVKGLPIVDMPGAVVARGDAQYGVGAVSEELMPGSEAVPLPAALDMHIDFSGAVLANAAAPLDAAAFLAFTTRPQARLVWTAFGIAAP